MIPTVDAIDARLPYRRTKAILLFRPSLKKISGKITMLKVLKLIKYRLFHYASLNSRHQYKAVWNKLAATEDSARKAVSGYVEEERYRESALATKQLLEQTVGVRSDDTILEIGAGVGRVGTVLAPVCKKWIGADVSQGMVAHIRRLLSSFPNVEAVEISGFDLSPIQSASVDMVYCTIVFMHLEEWDRYNYILEAVRVLKPGGRLYVDNMNVLTDEGWEFFETHRSIQPHRRPPYIGKTSTPQELINYFERAGMSEIKHQDAMGFAIVYGVKI